jgi:branched-chain amino acid transport system substrate-binding protein
MIDRKRFTALTAASLVAAGTRVSAQQTPTGSPYKIGVTFAQTGPLANTGAQWIPAAEIAVNHVNRAGGVKGHPLQLVTEDSQGQPQGGVTAMRKLVQVDGCQAILTAFTNIVSAQMPLAEQLKVPFLCSAQAPNLMGKTPYSFAHAETIPSMITLYREHWRKNNIKRVYGLYPNNAIATFLSPGFKASAAALGAEYGEATFNYGETDYRGLAARVKDFNPQSVVLAVAGGVDDTTIIKQVREIGVNAPIDLTSNLYDDPTWRAAVGSYVQGLVISGVGFDAVAAKRFLDEYRIKTGFGATPVAGEVYDMVKMFAWAIERAGYNGEAIAKELAQLKGVPSVFGGTITMDSEHYSPPAVALWRVKDGKLAKV